MVEQRFAAKGEAKPAEPEAEDRGELPGFFAMLAGAIGGFVAGYCFRATLSTSSRPRLSYSSRSA